MWIFSVLATCVLRCLCKPCIVSCIDAYVCSVSVAENISSWMPVTPIFLSRANIHLKEKSKKWLLLFFRILHVIIIITIPIEREDASFLFLLFWQSLLWTVSSLFYSCSTFLPVKCQIRHLGEDRLLNKVHYLFQIFPVKIVWTLAP